MERCSFCDHCGCTSKGEKVCTKHVIYVNEVDNFKCNDFCYTLGKPFLIITAAIALAALFTLIYTIA